MLALWLEGFMVGCTARDDVSKSFSSKAERAFR